MILPSGLFFAGNEARIGLYSKVILNRARLRSALALLAHRALCLLDQALRHVTRKKVRISEN